MLAPVARAYRYAVPGAVRRPVHNVLANMTSPVIFINDVVQTKPRRAGDTFMRFVINTTAGVGGLFDVASEVGYPYHDNDFGTTLALWGVPEGPFLFLPVLGPSNPRDATGYGVDILFDPLTYAPSGHGLRTLGYRPGRRLRGRLAGTRAGRGRLDQEDRARPVCHVPQPVSPEPREHDRGGSGPSTASTVPNWYAK